MSKYLAEFIGTMMLVINSFFSIFASLYSASIFTVIFLRSGRSSSFFF